MDIKLIGGEFMGFIKKTLQTSLILIVLFLIVALIIPEEWLESDEENVTSVTANEEKTERSLVDEMIDYFDLDQPTKPVTEMNDVEYLEMVYEPMIINAAKAADAVKNNYWEPTYVNGLMEYEDAEEILNTAIDYLDNLEHNIQQIPTDQFSKKVQKKADKLKETLAEGVNQRRDLIKVSKKMLKEGKYTKEEFSDQLKRKGIKDLDKGLQKANDKLYDLVYDR